MRSRALSIALTTFALACLPVRVAAHAQDFQCRFTPVMGAIRGGFADHSGHRTYQSTTNPSFGFLFTWPRTRASAIETGAIAERRGSSWFSLFAPDGRSFGVNGFERRLDLAYLLIPIRVRVGLTPAAVTPSLHVGMESGRRLWVRESTYYRNDGAQYHPASGSHPAVTDWEFAIAAGARLRFERVGRSPFVEVTYVSGRSSVDTSAFKVEGSLPSLANRGYRVLLGLDL